jgi:hypothetical protein
MAVVVCAMIARTNTQNANLKRPQSQHQRIPPSPQSGTTTGNNTTIYGNGGSSGGSDAGAVPANSLQESSAYQLASPIPTNQLGDTLSNLPEIYSPSLTNPAYTTHTTTTSSGGGGGGGTASRLMLEGGHSGSHHRHPATASAGTSPYANPTNYLPVQPWQQQHDSSTASAFSYSHAQPPAGPMPLTMTTGAGGVGSLGGITRSSSKKPKETRLWLDRHAGEHSLGLTLDTAASAVATARIVHRVKMVAEGSAAERVGLRKGDVITKVNGRDVSKLPGTSLAQLLFDLTAKAPVALHVRSYGSSRFSPGVLNRII